MKIIAAAMILLLPIIAMAQKDIIHFENIGRENGLAQSTITGIVQGKDGFMWFATAEGLHRYDGYDFKVFKHNNRDDNSLSNNHITALFEDNSGKLWIGTYTGAINLFDKATQTFAKITVTDVDSVVNKYPVNCFNQTKEGAMLIGLDGGGMVVMNPESGGYKIYTTENSSLPNNYVNCFSPEANDLGRWVGTEQGLILFNNGVFKEFSSLSLFANQYINDVLHYKSMVYIVTNGQGLQIWDTRKDIVQPIPSPRIRGANFTTFTLLDNVGNLWIGTNGGGLMKFDGERYVTYRNNPFDYRSLIGDEVTEGYLDNQGILWFGCQTGISKFDPNLQIFNLFKEFELNGKATNNNVYSIYETKDGMMWLGTLGSGLASYNPKTGEMEVFNAIKDPNSNIETKAVRALFEDNNGTFWVGSRDEGLFSFDRKAKVFKHHSPKNPAVKPNTIRHIMQDSEGKLWLSTRWGLMNYVQSTGEFKVYSTPYLQNNPIYQVIEDRGRNELLLVTFRSGLQIFNKEKKSFTVFRHGKDSTSPSVDAMMCIEQINADSFVIGTYGGGLNFFNRKNQVFSSFSSENGLPNDVVYGILSEDNKKYWLSTNAGLVQFNLADNSCVQYNMSHYLQGLEFNEGAYWKSQTNTFFFGGLKGFNFFNPRRMKPKSKPPKVVLTSFKILDEEIRLDRDINYVEQLEIEHNVDLISFGYASLTYTNSSATTYEYYLQGYDDKWINAGKRRVAYYGHLSPGTYIFKVRATTHDGIISDQERALNVIVHPPYWQTWWFRILMGLSALGLLALIFYARTKSVARSYKHQLIDLELKALRSQMNPHFIFNSLNSIQYFVLKNEPKAAYTYLTKFSNLMRMILQNSAVKQISVQAEIDWLTTYLDLEKLRLEDELTYEIKVDEDIDKESVRIPSMLIQPYVENAIIHGLLPKESNRFLRVSFTKHPNHISCVIEDNGIGRQKSKELNAKRIKKYKSQGIKLTGERLEILTRDLNVKPELRILDLKQDDVSSGTRVQIDIPIVKFKDEED